MRSAFSIISARLSVILCLEGKPAVPFNVGPQARLLDRLGQQVHTSADDLRDASLQCNQTEKVYLGVGIKFGGEVNVAVGLLIAASNGAEQR